MTSLPFFSFKIRNGRMTIVVIRILLILYSDHDACYCDDHAMIIVNVAVVVEAWQKRPTPMASSAPSASNCSVRRQDCKKCRRYQIQRALPKSSALSSKGT